MLERLRRFLLGDLEELRQHWFRLGFQDGRRIGQEEAWTGNIYRGTARLESVACDHDFRPSTGTSAGSTCRKCGAWSPPVPPPTITSGGLA